MPDEISAIWQSQPAEVRPDLLQHRTLSLSRRARAEILSAAGSAGFFVLLLVWRFEAIRDPYVFLTFVPIAAWLSATVWWHRRQICQSEATFAAPGIEFYRGELQRRLRHLRNVWLWHGPLLLACLSLGAIWLRKSVVSLERLMSILPLLLVLAIWVIMGVRRRHREANAMQKELDELA